MENCEAMTPSTHSLAYSYRLFKKCYDENYRNTKFHTFLDFYPIYIIFSLFSSIFFKLIILIKLKHGLDFSFKLTVTANSHYYGEIVAQYELLS